MATSGSKVRKKQIEHDLVVRAFAGRLRELRIQRGFSQQQLAQRAQIDISYVGRLERASAAPGIDLVGRLAKALDVSLMDLLPSAPATPVALLQDQARRRFESILTQADATALSTLNPWLALLDDALTRSK
jgi:transcriptional regulator with XRE-family HTH domain